MAIQRGLSVRCSPMRQHGSPVNGPLLSGHHLDLAYQVQRAAFYEKRTVKSYIWPFSTVAPAASSSSVNSVFNFIDGESSSASIPWLVHPNATRLKAVLYVALASDDSDLSIAIQTSTLLSAVTTTRGDLVKVARVGAMPRIGYWGRGFVSSDDEPVYSLGIVSVEVEPDYPADRALPFAIGFKGSFDVKADPSDSGITRKAAIMSARIFDIVDPPDPES